MPPTDLRRVVRPTDSDRRGPPRDGASPNDRADSALSAALRFIATTVAPTTLVTALLIYFGRQYVKGFTGYFRVDPSVFDFSTQDYLVRSTDAVFIPLVILIAVVALVLVSRRLIRILPHTRRSQLARITAPVAGAVGLALLALAAAPLLGSYRPVWVLEVGGLCLSVGVLAVAGCIALFRAAREGPRRGPSLASIGEWGAVFLLVSAGLFWFTNAYADQVGRSQAILTENGLHTAPDVVLYSTRDLGLQLPGVTSATCPPARGSDAASAYRYRYEGLKFVLQSGGYYLFLPASWARTNGTAVVLPRTDSLRLEFTLPHAVPRRPCAAP